MGVNSSYKGDGFFHPPYLIVNDLLWAIVEKNINVIVRMISDDPNLLIKKGEVVDTTGRTFTNITPMILSQMYNDPDINNAILPLIPRPLRPMIHAQLAEWNQEVHHLNRNIGMLE